MLLMEDYMKQQLREEEKRREMVQKVVDTHENAKEAKIKMQEFKAKIGTCTCTHMYIQLYLTIRA